MRQYLSQIGRVLALMPILFFMSAGQASAEITYEYRGGGGVYDDLEFGYNDIYGAGALFIPQQQYKAQSISFAVSAFAPVTSKFFVDIYETTDGKTFGALIARSSEVTLAPGFAPGCLVGASPLMYECFTPFLFDEPITFITGTSYLIVINATEQAAGAYLLYHAAASIGESLVVHHCSQTECASGNGRMWIVFDDTPIEQECCSSVVFIPGIQGSRLYSRDRGGSKLWEPFTNSDVQKLFLDTDGESIDPSIYTEDVIEDFEAFSLGGPAIYKKFVQSMNTLTGEGVIAGWRALPYDWRQSVGQIVAEGVHYSDGVRDMVETIEALAGESRSGKVTIVAHSNGGLVAKALMQKLESQGKEGLVDKIIFVAVPQLGTPDAIKVLLHGMSLGFGLVMDSDTSRRFGEYMPGAYGLLPSNAYFDAVDEPIVVFDPSIVGVNNFVATYGTTVSDKETLDKFLSGVDGRKRPVGIDTSSPNILSSTLLEQASALHRDLDVWQPPEGVEIVEVAGWGINTLKGVRYVGTYPCTKALTTGPCAPRVHPEPITTIEGDKTVVYPSALVIGSKKYFFDVRLFNKITRERIDHKNIFEAKAIIDFVESEIKKIQSSSDFVSSDLPQVEQEDHRIVVSMHSPASIDLYDDEGNHTGLVTNPHAGSDLGMYEEEIPNSFYMEFDEATYAGFDEDSNAKVTITGTGVGTFTFIVEKKTGDSVESVATFADIPVTPSLKASYDPSEGPLPVLRVDIEGDGTQDAVITPSADGTISPLLFLQMMKRTIVTLELPRPIEKMLMLKIDKAIKIVSKNKKTSIVMLIKLFGQKGHSFEHGRHKGKLTQEQKAVLVVMFNTLLDNIK